MAASHREWLVLWGLLVLAALAGCSRGPEGEVLEANLQYRLDTHFEQGLFGIHRFRRTGSAGFRDLETGVSGLHVYYDAELVFRHDYDLTRWGGLNLGTLAFAIGATESGISGFRSAGNASGDLLKVHGRLSYESDGAGGWVSLDRKPEPAKPHLAGDAEGRGPDLLLADARDLLASEEQVRPDTRQAVIVEELERALNRIDLRTARLEGKIILGTGLAAGTYFAFGEALSEYAQQQEQALFSASSEGSVENISRLQRGRLDFGLVQSDVAQFIYESGLKRRYFPFRELRAVASLWPEAVHLLTLAGSGIETLEDLRDRRIAIGQRGSGSRVNAVLIGLAAEFEAGDFPAIREIRLEQAIEQLEGGELDALFLTEAVPAPAVQALAARREDLRFVPIPMPLLERLSRQHSVYYPLTVAARTYPGQREPFTTLGLTAALITHADVPDERVEEMLRLLLTGADELARDYYRAALISRETMRLGLAVPLHPAAERFYREYDEAASQEPATANH